LVDPPPSPLPSSSLALFLSPALTSLVSSVRNNLLELLRDINDLLILRKEKQGSTPQDHLPRLGLVIFSLSEIVLFLGETWTLSWLRKLNLLISPAPTKAATDKSDPLAAIILLLHSSLHQATFQSEIQVPLLPPSLLHSLLQKICPIVVSIKPNLSGIFGPSIHCTVKTLRSSPKTSKVTEAIDFFAQITVDNAATDTATSTGTSLRLTHVSTNYFNGIELSSTATGASVPAASPAAAEDRALTSANRSLGSLSLGPRGGMETSASASAGSSNKREETSLSASVHPENVNLGVQMIKPSFAILNQHDGEEDEDLDDDPDADLDL
jgi:hypothetical protein